MYVCILEVGIVVWQYNSQNGDYFLGIDEAADPTGIEPGAVSDVLAGGSSVRLLFKHGQQYILLRRVTTLFICMYVCMYVCMYIYVCTNLHHLATVSEQSFEILFLYLAEQVDGGVGNFFERVNFVP